MAELYNAFVNAVACLSSQEGSHIVFEGDVNVAVCAQELAHAGGAVVLVIPSNFQQLGNHWVNDEKALRAMEENVYRRSPTLAELGYLLNGSSRGSSLV